MRRNALSEQQTSAIRRSSADANSASGLLTTAASRACENSRPIAAPICATSFAGPSRSSRAISEACKLAGTASAGEGIAATVRCDLAFAFGLQHRLGHLLDEQGNAVSALDNVLANIRRQRLVADNAVDHGVDIALCKPIDGESGHMGLSRSRAPRTLAGTSRSAEREGSQSGRRSTERFQARGVGPMRIFEDHQHRILS